MVCYGRKYIYIMNHLQFIEQLAGIPLPDEAYKQVGLSSKYIKDIKKNYIPLNKKVTNKKDVPPDNAILSLMAAYDMSKVSIGMVEFNKKIEHDDDLIIFGKFEVDRMAIDRVTGEVLVLDETSDKIMWRCAQNGGAFLEALIYIGKFLEKRVVDDNLYEDEKANLKIAKTCSEIAGGVKYLKFFKMMLGY